MTAWFLVLNQKRWFQSLSHKSTDSSPDLKRAKPSLLCLWILADIAPVWEGAIQHNAVKRFEIAGQDLTDLLAKELAKSQPDVKLDLATVEMLKEKYATVCEDSLGYAATAEVCPKIEHTLPDGQVYTIAF